MNRLPRDSVRPPLIETGDCIGVCEPSGAYDPDVFAKGVSILESLGFRVRLPAGTRFRKRYMAAGDTERADSVNALFQDPEVKAVICARGGFGTLRALPMIDFDLIRQNPKPLIGFSDCTALLVTVVERSLLQVIHGPVVTSLATDDRATIDALYLALVSPELERTLTDPVVLRGGHATGTLVGGNLTTLAHLTGTEYQPDLNGCILFIEDVSEAPYRIDRMLSHLKLAGLLDGVAGVMAGSFENCGDIGLIHEILLDIFESDSVPVLAGVDAGHGVTNRAFVMGGRVILDTDAAAIRWVSALPTEIGRADR